MNRVFSIQIFSNHKHEIRTILLTENNVKIHFQFICTLKYEYFIQMFQGKKIIFC